MHKKRISGEPPEDPEQVVEEMRPPDHLDHEWVEDANNILDEMLEVVNWKGKEPERFDYYIERRAELWTEVYNQYLRWMGAEFRVRIYFDDGVIQID